MQLDTVIIQFYTGPESRQSCYRLGYDPVSLTINQIFWSNGITWAALGCVMVLFTTWQEVLDYMDANSITFNIEDWPELDTSH